MQLAAVFAGGSRQNDSAFREGLRFTL